MRPEGPLMVSPVGFGAENKNIWRNLLDSWGHCPIDPLSFYAYVHDDEDKENCNDNVERMSHIILYITDFNG